MLKIDQNRVRRGNHKKSRGLIPIHVKKNYQNRSKSILILKIHQKELDVKIRIRKWLIAQNTFKIQYERKTRTKSIKIEKL